jgi:hypothetical protein
MNPPTVRLFVITAGAALALAVAALPSARSQIMATPSYVPVGVSSSGGSSTAWFHEPSSRQVLACQTVTAAPNGAASGVQCVSTKMP